MDNSLNNIHNIEEPFINLIMGPMFSVKTTQLINTYNEYVKNYGIFHNFSDIFVTKFITCL